jgi:hypothetical protein
MRKTDRRRPRGQGTAAAIGTGNASCYCLANARRRGAIPEYTKSAAAGSGWADGGS